MSASDIASATSHSKSTHYIPPKAHPAVKAARTLLSLVGLSGGFGCAIMTLIMTVVSIKTYIVSDIEPFMASVAITVALAALAYGFSKINQALD